MAVVRVALAQECGGSGRVSVCNACAITEHGKRTSDGLNTLDGFTLEYVCECVGESVQLRLGVTLSFKWHCVPGNRSENFGCC